MNGIRARADNVSSDRFARFRRRALLLSEGGCVFKRRIMLMKIIHFTHMFHVVKKKKCKLAICKMGKQPRNKL